MDCLNLRSICCCPTGYATDTDIRLEATESTRLVDYPSADMRGVKIKVDGGQLLNDVGLNNEAYISFHSSRGWLLVQPVQNNAPDVHPLKHDKARSNDDGQHYSVTFTVHIGGNSTEIPVDVTIPNGMHARAMSLRSYEL